MKILIVEDTNDKMKEIEKQLKIKFKQCEIVETRSYSEGIKNVYKNGWDLIILDMSLPTYTVSHTENGGAKKPMAGSEIIKRMYSRKIYIPTIVITQFDIFGESQISLDSLNQEFEKKYGIVWKGTISYNKQGWQGELADLLEKLKIGA